MCEVIPADAVAELEALFVDVTPAAVVVEL